MKPNPLFDGAPKSAKDLLKLAAKLKRDRIRKAAKDAIYDAFDGEPTKADYRAAFKKGSK